MAVSIETRASRTADTMWFFIFVSAMVCASVSADAGDDALVLHKCCPNNQSIKRVTDSENIAGIFECIDPEDAQNSYNLSISPLVVGLNVPVLYGIPEQCDEVQMVEVISTEIDIQLKNYNDQCYDRLVIVIVNDTVKQYIPKMVALTCVRNETEKLPKNKLTVNQFRKCCPNGQSYDSEFHLCRNSNVSSNESWLLKHLEVSDTQVFEVNHVLTCKRDEYSVELRESLYSIELEGSKLKVTKKDGADTSAISRGEWCIDRDFVNHKLVARVCTRDCTKYDAMCLNKCCPLGYHFRPRRCDTFVSQCVPNSDEILFNLTDYIGPLEQNDSHISDVLGFGNTMNCKERRTVLNRSLEIDHHRLMPDGRLLSPLSYDYNFCLESFDRRSCPNGNVVVTAVSCFIKAPDKKDFRMSFVFISISSVCLTLTLVVYVSLAELRNLHGRTLICHVCTMLLAFCCLARVQYSYVPPSTCTLLGYGIYFGFVAAFAWLNVMCFDIWWTFGSVRTVQPMRKASAELRRFLWYSLYAWSFAILLTLTMFLFDRYPVTPYLDANIGEGICWFGTLQNSQADWPHYIYFVIPMGLISIINFVLWVLTARHCARVKSEVHRLQAGSIGERAKRRFRMDRAKYVLTGKLWIVMGASWISELLSTLAPDPVWLWSVLDLINELQGVFIFLILVIKPKVYYLIRKRLGLEKPDAQKNGASSSARTSSTFLSRTISLDERANTRLSLQNNVKQS